MTNLGNSVQDLKMKMEHFIHVLPKDGVRDEKIAELERPGPAHLGGYRDAEALGQFGHGKLFDHRDLGAGVVTTLAPNPVKGAI